MDNIPPVQAPKKKYSSAMIAVIICAALVAGAVAIAIISPEGGFDILPSLTDTRSKVHYSDMEYTRPDADALIASFDDLIAMIKRGDSFTAQRSVYNRINTDYTDFMTMLTLANLHYSRNTSDEYYKTEYFDLEKASITIGNKLNELMDTIAASEFKVNYERSYYGVGYFTDWVNLVYPDEVVALMEKETELIEEYTTLMTDPYVVLNGKAIHLYSDDLTSLSENEYAEVIYSYYEKYNDLAGKIYVDLVKTRMQIAEKLDTDYISFAYSEFDRDYTPKQATDYLDSVAESIIPAISKLEFDDSFIHEYCDPLSAIYAVSDGAKNMKSTVNDAFDYMFKYGLYDASFSHNKLNASYTTYLYNYNVPFMFVSPQNTAYDFFTVSHEFGHFVDSYQNQGMVPTIDAAEVASQAMAYIMPHYTNALYGFDSEALADYAVYAAADIYTTQCYITRFEHEVYALSADELTLDKINAIAYDCAKEFGLSDYADLYKMAWVEIHHVFEVPFYTISYVISNDVAMQVLDAELKAPGKGGVEAYLDVIDRDMDLSFIDETVDSGFESPFADGRAEKIAQLITDALTESPDEELTPLEGASEAVFANSLIPAA